jgi:hypothetical protein
MDRHGARAEVSVVVLRQRNRLLEGLSHDREVAAMRQPIRKNGNGHACEDPEDAECRPERDGAKDALAARERVHHAPEQNGLGELHEPDSDGSHCERDGEPFFSPEQADCALVESEEVHIRAPHAIAGSRGAL